MPAAACAVPISMYHLIFIRLRMPAAAYDVFISMCLYARAVCLKRHGPRLLIQ